MQNQSHNAAPGTYIVAVCGGIIALIIVFMLVRGGGSTTPPGPTARTPTPAITRTINPCPAAGCIATRTPTPTHIAPTEIATVPAPVPSEKPTIKPPTPQSTVPPPVPSAVSTKGTK